MSKIESHSVFGHYSQTENRVTAALLQILKMGGTEFIGKVISELDDIEFPSSEINIVTQEKENKNVYDGLLECNFSFRVLVESKIKQETINVRQLEGLIDNAKNPNDYILFISPENKKPEILNSYSNKIYWANWKGILGILKDLNPKKIKNLEIIKGNSAVAIYGRDGNNGVVVVTTKKGFRKKN